VILIISHAKDDHAQGVLSELSSRKHPFALVDSAQFPSRATLNQRFSANGVAVEYVSGGRLVNLNECNVAWWRRSLPFTLHDGLDPDLISFTYSECHEAFFGALELINATWVNPPKIDERAHHKPLQLATAVQVGLPVPRTLITNDPDEARNFIEELGPANTIYKTFLATQEYWRETRVIHDQEMQMLDSVAFAPVIFQEYIAAEADIRVTILDDQIFAADIRSNPHGYTIDYRMDMGGAAFMPTSLPDDVTDRLFKLMGKLGLVYGAVDLLRTAEGQYIFLEVNPAGEWRFVEERTGQPITAAMANLLIRLDGLPKG